MAVGVRLGSWAAGRLGGWAVREPRRYTTESTRGAALQPARATEPETANVRALGRLHKKAAYRSLIVNQPCIEQYRLYFLVEVRVLHAGPHPRGRATRPATVRSRRGVGGRGVGPSPARDPPPAARARGPGAGCAEPVGRPVSNRSYKYNDIRRYRKNCWIRARVDVRDPRTGSERSRQGWRARDGWSATRRRCVVFEPRKRAAGRLTDPTRGETRDGSDLTDPSRCAEVPTYRYIAPRVLMLAGTVSATRDYEYAL